MEISTPPIIMEIVILIIIFTRSQNCLAENQNPHSFSYTIDSDGILSYHAEETKCGVVRGSFSFLQPDGQIRVVQYEADNKSGFKVVVNYRKIQAKLMGHLRYPKDFQHPLLLVAPVSLITSDLFEPEILPDIQVVK